MKEMMTKSEMLESWKKLKRDMIKTAQKTKECVDERSRHLIDDFSDRELGELYETAKCFDKTISNSGVYFIKNEETGLTKIGCSGDIEKRIKSIKRLLVNNGYNPKFKLLGIHFTFEDHKRLAERYYHELFQEFRVVGEWFRLAEEDLITQVIEYSDCGINLKEESDGCLLVSYESYPESCGFKENKEGIAFTSLEKEYDEICADIIKDKDFPKEAEHMLKLDRFASTFCGNKRSDNTLWEFLDNNKNIALGACVVRDRNFVTAAIGNSSSSDPEVYTFDKLKMERVCLQNLVDYTCEMKERFDEIL